jgi:isoaspartyl peptidase/L-asparaginase-like protein (Ntn-hydrolase superfamily)
MLISTWSFGQRGHAAAWPALSMGGSALDAVERVCAHVDADPAVDSVGFGGLPDARGHVTLDGCIMISPSRCGSVCCIRRHMHPVSIARRVMEKTDHIMLAGDGADAFAQNEGFLHADLLSADAQDAYHRWLKDHAPVNQTRDRGTPPHTTSSHAPRPIDIPGGGGKLFFHPADPGPADETNNPKRHRAQPQSDEDRWRHHDTIGVLAIDGHGGLAGACSTSGTPFKLPGRVGDSPTIGHGLYVDPAAGAATATGTGELIMSVCGSFLTVECMRRGATPIDALRQTLQRIIDTHELKPEHQVALIAVRPDGAFASAALRGGYRTSIRMPHRDEVIEPDAVMLGD